MPDPIDRSRVIRRSEKSSAEPSAGGVAPPTIDVLPPCGTRGTRCSAARRTIAAASSVEPGERIAAASPWKRPRQSVSQGSTSEGTVTTVFGPKRSRTSSINSVTPVGCRVRAMSAALARNGRLGIARFPPHSCSRELLAPSRNPCRRRDRGLRGCLCRSAGTALGEERPFEPARLMGPLLRARLGRHDDQQLWLRARRGRRSGAISARNVPAASGAAEGRARDPPRHETAGSELRTRWRPACAAWQSAGDRRHRPGHCGKRRALLPGHLWRKRAAPLRPGERPPPALQGRQLRCRAERRGVERLWRSPRVLFARRRGC